MRTRSIALAASAALLTGIAVTPAALAAGSGGTGSVTMCHRTRSVTNPYREITVSQSAVTGNNGAGGGNGSGHGGHTGPVFDPTPGYYTTHAKDWGDVIPPFGNYRGLNTTGALPAAPSCRAMPAGEFYNVQREAGVPRAEVIADLQEQGALGDPSPDELAALVYTGSDPTLAAEDGVATTPPGEQGTGTDPSPDPQPEPDTGSQPAPDPEPQPDTGSQPGTGTGTEPEPGTDVEPGTDPQPDTDTDTDTDQPGTEPEPDTDVEPGTDPQPDTDTDTDTDQPSTEPQPQPGTPTPTPAPTPTPPDAVTPAPVGTQRITGLVWLDRDRDRIQDGAAEPGLPSVTVELYRVELAGGGTARGRAASAARTAAAPDAVAQVQTAADGAFAFTGLSAGAYAVRVRYPASLAVTWDSEGLFDASAQVLVPESGEAQAQVGLAGDARADLRVRTASGGPVTGTVLLWWAGPDGAFGTADDVRVPVEAVDGRVLVDGVPAGDYRVVGPDGSTVSRTLALTAEGGTSTVTLGADPVPAPAVAAPALAATGSPAAALLATASWLVVGGLVLARVARRVRRSR